MNQAESNLMQPLRVVANKARKVSENVLLAYFAEKSKKKFTKLVPYLKKLSVGNHPKKSKVLTREKVNHFIKEEDNETYLMVKVVLILDISGAAVRN
ncbi:hypothetical protein NQ317_018921 [Molorchus minor]|uniref:Uncharacterized protein n=1 Tax=Molorchus minor TaxID=1323400 RepID=A0ABQ9ISK5_9CUCU|nr:hypothetical protein NQ317_018921 [Molorchus minor]